MHGDAGRIDRAREWEQRLFVALNDGPDWSWLRVPQQLGTPWALVATSAVLAACGRRRRALAALAVLPAEKLAEVALKEVTDRPRPWYRVPTALRDDAPVEGGSMPSGHVAIAAACAWLLSHDGPRWLGWTLGTAVALNGYVRVHQGAHWPTDVLVGAALGTGLAAAATATVERIGR